MVGVVSDLRFMDHETGGCHPESPMRIQYLHTLFVREDPLVRLVDPVALSLEDALLIHDGGYLDSLARASASAGITSLDPDTVCSEDSYEVSLLAAGSLVKLTRLALEREIDSGFACVRPPGHHARRDCAMGFCLLNNAAICARKAIGSFGLERVAVIDFDIHHGNGTQESFYSDSRVLYFSSHQYPFYPGTGALHETGTGEGEGYTVNCPMSPGKEDGHYLALYRWVLLPILEEFEPELILVSAGFDPHAMDPIGGMKLSSAGFAAIAAVIREAALGVGAPAVYCLEGGYSLPALRESVSMVMDILKGGPAPEIEPLAFEELEGFVRTHGRTWPLSLT
ncbi:MAG: histone deacetylase [Desulfomonilia bacterium]|jgi:acetoin utilization deacetylase AcuC-like enzyme